MAWSAVVFDLFFTLAWPEPPPGRRDRRSWLASLTGVDENLFRRSWSGFEARLERGELGPSADGLLPELAWVAQVAAEAGVALSHSTLAAIERDWDLAQRRALLSPPAEAMDVLSALRRCGLRLGLLSNTHALEVKVWPRSPLAERFDAVSFSDETGATKPDETAYGAILGRLGANPSESVYVGDGSGDELLGAKRVGFGLVVLLSAAASRFGPERLPTLKAQADVVIDHLRELPQRLAL